MNQYGQLSSLPVHNGKYRFSLFNDDFINNLYNVKKVNDYYIGYGRVDGERYTCVFYKKFYKSFLHGLKKPAVKWECGVNEWYKNGKRHRLNGRAIEVYGDFDDVFEDDLYYVNGICMSKDIFNNWIKKIIYLNKNI